MTEAYGEILESGALRFERLLPGPLERVWAYLVEPEKRALWFSGGGTGDAPGDRFAMAFDHDRLSHEPLPERYAHMQGGVEMEVEIVEIEPPRLIVFRGAVEDFATRIELSEKDGGVLLVLTQEPPTDLNKRVDTGAGWQAHLAILADRLKGDTPRGFWTVHERARDYYAEKLGIA